MKNTFYNGSGQIYFQCLRFSIPLSLSLSLSLSLCSTIFTGWVPTLLRAGRGMTLWDKAGAVPAEKLELFSYENNPVRDRCSALIVAMLQACCIVRSLIMVVPSPLRTFWIQCARIVREALCELELPYVLQNVGEGSSRTDLLLRKSGSKQVIIMLAMHMAHHEK
jgi:hypothetical protein